MSPNNHIAVLLADASQLGCEVLSVALKNCRYRFHVTQCVSNSSAVNESLREQQPQVAVVSARLDDGELAGFKALRAIRAKLPLVPVVLIVDSLDSELVVSAFRSGARGIFPRTGCFDDLCKCIHQVSHGQIWASSNELQIVLDNLTSIPQRPRVVDARGLSLLTRRQEEVVTLVGDGLTNREIAARLKLSEHTVKNYLFRIFDKLGVSSRMELILYAANHREQRKDPSPHELPAA